MAYIDDNNDLAAGKGKDPIAELDAELEQILAELDGMKPSEDGSEKETAEESGGTTLKIEDEKTLPADFDVKKPEIDLPQDEEPAKPPKKRGKGVWKAILCVIIIGLVAAGGWGIYKLMNTRIIADDEVETETFSDPELGEVEVKKVEGASLNTYDTGKLAKNDKGFYEYTENGAVTSEVGVDIAEYQGDVDFAAVKASGVDFVMLRIGGRYYSDEGALYKDTNFDAYYQQAKDAGLKIGAYFFSQATNADEAAEEAKAVIKDLDGKTLEYPVGFDWEFIEDDTARTDHIRGTKTLTEMAEKFCDTITKNGYKAIVYATTALMLKHYDFETMKDYDFWLADYRELPNMYYDFTMWQYSKKGTVDGIDGSADLNICFKPYGS